MRVMWEGRVCVLIVVILVIRVAVSRFTMTSFACFLMQPFLHRFLSVTAWVTSCCHNAHKLKIVDPDLNQNGPHLNPRQNSPVPSDLTTLWHFALVDVTIATCNSISLTYWELITKTVSVFILWLTWFVSLRIWRWCLRGHKSFWCIPLQWGICECFLRSGFGVGWFTSVLIK